MAKKCKNCGEEALTVHRKGAVFLRVFCTNCGEVQEEREYTDEREYHDKIHKGKRDEDKYRP